MSQAHNVRLDTGLVSSGDKATVTSNQVISPSGATTFDSSSAAITDCTLPVPVQAGVIKVLLQVGTGTNNVVVNSLFTTGTTSQTSATMNAAGESLLLVSTGSRWQVVINTGSVSMS